MTRPSRPDAKVRGATAAALPCNSPLQQIRLFRRPSRGEGPVSAGPAAMDGRKVDSAHTTLRSSCKNFEHSHALSFHRIVSGKTCFFSLPHGGYAAAKPHGFVCLIFKLDTGHAKRCRPDGIPAVGAAANRSIGKAKGLLLRNMPLRHSPHEKTLPRATGGQSPKRQNA